VELGNSAKNRFDSISPILRLNLFICISLYFIVFITSDNDNWRSYVIDLCVSWCVCQQLYCKSNQQISMKLCIMIGPTNWKNQFTFGGDAIPDTDSGSLFHFPLDCRIGHLGALDVVQTVCVIDLDNTGLKGQLTPAFSSRSRTVVFTHTLLSKCAKQVLVFSFVRSGMLRNLKIAQL